MDWRQTMINWVNSLKMNGKNVVVKIEDLQNGRFFGEVLEFLFHKERGIGVQRVYLNLQNALTDLYLPNEWIDYELAQLGDVNELEKILTVIIGIHLAQEGASRFTILPAETLSPTCQIRIRDFIIYVMKHGNVVTPEALAFIKNHEVRESGRTSTIEPRVLFPPTHESEEDESENGDIYSGSPLQELNVSTLPNLIISASAYHTKRMLSASRNDASALRRKVYVLEKSVVDLQELFEEEREKRRGLEADLGQERANSKKTNHKLEVLYTEHELLQRQLSAVLQEQADTQLKLGSAKARLHSLSSEMATSQKSARESDNRVITLESQLSIIKHKLTTAQKSLAASEGARTEMEEMFQLNSKELILAQHQISNMEKELKESQDVAQEAREELSVIMSNHQSLKTVLESKLERLEKVELELQRALDTESLTNHLLCEAKKDIVRIQEESLSTQKQNEDLQHQLTFAQGQLKCTKDQLKCSQHQLGSRLIEVQNLREEINTFKAELQDKFDSIRQEAEAGICALGIQLAEALKETHHLQLQLYGAKQSAVSLEEVIKQKEKNVEKLEQMNNKLATSLKKLLEELHSRGAQQESQRLEFQELERDMEANLKRTENELGDVIKENSSLKAEMASIEAKTKEITKEELQKSYTALFNDAKKQMTESYRREVDRLQEETETHKREKAQCRATVIELTNRVGALERACREKDAKIALLEEKAKHDAFLLQQSTVSVSSFGDADSDSSRRLSIQSNGSGRMKVVPNGSGSLFQCDDEEEFPYNESNFEEQMGRRGRGRCAKDALPESVMDEKRISELQRRNSLLPPHLRSVYSMEYATLGTDIKLNEQQFRLAAELAKTVNKSMSVPNVAHANGPVPAPPKSHLINVTKEQLPGPTPKKSGAVRGTRPPFSPTSFNVNGGSRAQLTTKGLQSKPDSGHLPDKTQSSATYSTAKTNVVKNLMFSRF